MQLILSKNCHIQPSEIDNMPFYWIEMLIDEFTEMTERENKQYKEQKSEYATNLQQPNIPKVNIPRVSMPSMSSFK